MTDVRPPALPAGAPPDLVAFVACRSERCELVNGKVRWLPAPPGVPRGLGRFLAPSLTVGPGATPGEAELAVGWGPVKLRLRAAVAADGSLVLTPVGTPPPGLAGVVASFDSWATQLNRWLASHGRRLGPPAVAPGRLVLVKQRPEP